MSDLNWDAVDVEPEESETDVDWGGRDGVVFLIDATSTMLGKDEGATDTFFLTALKCSHMTMLKKVMGSEKDLIAVVLFGTAKTNNPLSANHLTILQELEQPNIDKIKSLDKMIKSDSFDDFENKYGRSDNYNLQEALWLCNYMFSNCEMKMGQQRILLFTANDEPHSGNRTEQQRAMDRANDLHGLNISLELLPLGPDFDTSLFYKDLIEAAMGTDYAEQALPQSAHNLGELLLRTCRYSHKKRSQGRVLLYLGKDLAIGVGIYSMLRKRPMPKRIWLERSTNQPVKARTLHYSLATGELALPMDIMKYKRYGGKAVTFKPEETKISHTLLDRGIYIMGFKPKERVKFEHHFKKPYFLFPDENQVKGSRKLFAALLNSCAERGKVAICWGVLRRGAAARLFALFPQLEKIDEETGVQEIAGGFHAYPLPLSGNIRSLPFEQLRGATPEQMDFMANIVSKLTFRYSVHNFQNPRLQTLWAGIEALALDLPSPRKVEDHTKPNLEVITRKLGDLGKDFHSTFYPEDFSPEGKSARKPAAKRGAGNGAGASQQKKAKAKDDSVDVEDFARRGQAAKLKVDQLKAFLMAKGKRVTGKKKSELIDMVCQELDIDNS